ncbi:MAG TPA: phosphatase PAP2 family protein [Candidatus Eisenbacteria bacterium]|nr:phosphatase PAP2 family protein [Candidatus Eisenbacteria bacterium]
MTFPWQAWDDAVFRQLHIAWRHPFLDPIFRAFTDPGKLLLPVLLILLALFWMRRRRGLLGLLVLAATITVSDQTSAKLLKPIFQRPRPSIVVADAQPMFGARGSYAFPSVHATNAFAAALVLDAVFPGARLALLTVASLVAYSRIYVGDHWPSDVLAGALLGSLIGWGGRILFFGAAARWGERRAAPRRDPATATGAGGTPSAGR